MSQKPFSLDRALSNLRSVAPDRIPDLDQLSVTRHRRFSYRPVAIMVAGCLAMAVLWPRPGSGQAWAQVADSVRRNQRFYVKTTEHFSDGMITERWVDGNKFAMRVWLSSTGDPVLDVRCNGEFYTYVSTWEKPRNGAPVTAYRARYVEGVSPQGGVGGSSFNLVSELIQNVKFNVLEEGEVQTEKGPMTRFKIARSSDDKLPQGRPLLVYSEPESGLIRKVEYTDHTGEKVIATNEVEYPRQMDQSVFLFTETGYPVQDLDEDRRRLVQNLKSGLGVQTVGKEAVALRAVLYDLNGDLWILWTGHGPSTDLRHRVQIESGSRSLGQNLPSGPRGFHTRQGFLTSTDAGEWETKPISGLGQRLVGMAINLCDQKFDRVTVTIPVVDASGRTKLGEATFRDVPVHRITSIDHFAKELGIR